MNEHKISANCPVRINHVYKWRNPRETLWSGTPFGILNAMKKCYDPVDIDLNEYHNIKIWKILCQGTRYGFKKAVMSVLGGDYGYLDKVILEKTLSNKLKEKIPTIVYTDYLCRDTKWMYVYQDLSVGFCIRQLQSDAPNDMPFTKNKHFNKRSIEHEKKFYEKCAGIFTMSQWLKDDIVKNTGINPDKICVVNAGCNVAIEDIGTLKKKLADKNGKRFLFVGKDWYRKNGPLVVEAFKRLMEKEPTAELYLIGPGFTPENIPDDSRIHFLGELSYQEVKTYYNKCDFFVMPSRFEAYGIVFSESLLNGLPCIGRNAYAMPEIIESGKTGYITRNDTPEELADAMVYLINHRDEMVNYILDHRDEYIERYSWDGVARKMINFIAENESKRSLKK